MRLAIVRQRYNPFGGAERFIERAASALAGRLSITVYAREWTGAGSAPVVVCAPFHIGRLWRDMGFARQVCRVLATSTYDLVQSHERLACCDVYRAGDGVHASWLDRRAFSLGWFGRIAIKLNPYHRYVLAAERRLFEGDRLKAVICNSQMVRDEILARFAIDESKLRVVYNGVNLEEFHPRCRAEHRADGRAMLGIPESSIVYLFVGSGFERKGVSTLLRAFARLADRDSQLVIVGQDKAEAAMKRLAHELGISGHVHFAGPQASMQAWYGLADVFVLPTLYDPFPNAALEAFASGLPVITTSSSGIAEFVKHLENGAICENPRSVEELADCMRAIGPVAADLSADARSTAERLGIDAMADRLVALYRELVPEAGI